MSIDNPCASPKTASCTVKILPKEKWLAAASRASAINPANVPAAHMLRAALPGTVLPAAHLALLTTKYWGTTGVRLTVGFLDNPEPALRNRIISHMNAWNTDAGANVTFTETRTDPQVRIARTPGDGYWSYIGVDITQIAPDQPTLNLDSFTMQTLDSEFRRVVRHETGHTLGFPHEHARPDIVSRINPEKAITYFMQTQGWTREDVIAQVLTPIAGSTLLATPLADPDSIMCYWLPADIMNDHVAITGGTDIDDSDKTFAAKVYPQ